MYGFFLYLPNIYSFSEILLVLFYEYLLFSYTLDFLTRIDGQMLAI